MTQTRRRGLSEMGAFWMERNALFPFQRTVPEEGNRMQSIQIYEMPDCKMVSSGVGMFGEGRFVLFDNWLALQERSMFPKDFLYETEEGFVWLRLFEKGMQVPPELEIMDFPGGLYAVATDRDQGTDLAAMNAQVDEFLRQAGFVRDGSRVELGNVITSPRAREILGYDQMDYYTPIKAIERD